MNYRKLGKTEMFASEVGLGCEYFSKATPEESKAMVDEAVKAGMNIIDVFMSDPVVRSKLGDAVAPFREKMLLQGHVGAAWVNGQYLCSRDLAVCKEFVADFLHRFHTDYIDIGMLHYIDTEEEWQKALDNGILDYMNEQKQLGVFKCLGVSTHNAVIAQTMAKTGWFDVIMFSVSPLFDLVLPEIDTFFEMPEEEAYPTEVRIDPERIAFYQLCEEMGVSITVMKTLAAGSLLDVSDSPFGSAMTVPQCIQYALDRPGVASALIGCKNVEEVRVAASFAEASEAERDYHGILSQIRGDQIKVCMYCNHCLPCPVHIDIAATTRLLDTAKNKGWTPELQQAYDALNVKASACIACGHCVRRCPFAIDVIANMKEAMQMFGRK